MPHRLAQQVGDQTVWGGPATALERQNWLTRGLTCLVNVYLYVIGILLPDKVEEYQGLVNAILVDVKRVNAVISADSVAPTSPNG